MRTRLATPEDAEAIARIYSQGIEDRVATFETRLRTKQDVLLWFDGVHPIVVVEDEKHVIGFGATFPYRSRRCYAGIAEVSLYVSRAARGRGAGTMMVRALVKVAGEAGFWKLVSRIFPENHGSRRLVQSAGFREVGTYEKHGKLDGVWRDVIIVERLIPANLR